MGHSRTNWQWRGERTCVPAILGAHKHPAEGYVAADTGGNWLSSVPHDQINVE